MCLSSISPPSLMPLRDTRANMKHRLLLLPRCLLFRRPVYSRPAWRGLAWLGPAGQSCTDGASSYRNVSHRSGCLQRRGTSVFDEGGKGMDFNDAASRSLSCLTYKIYSEYRLQATARDTFSAFCVGGDRDIASPSAAPE